MNRRDCPMLGSSICTPSLSAEKAANIGQFRPREEETPPPQKFEPAHPQAFKKVIDDNKQSFESTSRARAGSRFATRPATPNRHLGQHRRVRPRRVSDKVKQRLMLCCYLSRRGHCRHRLHALALDRHQQAQAIIAQRFLSIGMAQGRAQLLDIGGKSRLTIPS
jgi:hypothetical protein